MELIFRACAAAVISAAAALLLKKNNPEGALLLGAITVVALVTASLGLLGGLQELRAQVRAMLGGSEIYMAPVIKCLAIAIVTRFATDLCKDASQNATASAVEFTGGVCGFAVILPLLWNVLKLIGGLV